MRIYITEDEPLAAAKLKLFIEKLGYGGDITLFPNGDDLLNQLADSSPDVLFLDINMPGISGIDVIRQINGRFPVILTTAYDQYALEGFNYGVRDYLLKPYTLDRLKQAFERLPMQIVQEPAPKAPQDLELRVEGRTEIVPVSDIMTLESQRDYTELTLTDGRRMRTLVTLSSLAEKLPDSFKRVHRSWVVNTTMIQSYTSTDLTMKNGAHIPVGRKFKE